MLALVVIVAGTAMFSRYRVRSNLAVPEKSIAVLPFENRSEDKTNAYFADGIQDEILTRLSKIADLKVISRTSTQHYKSAPENLRDIARQLGVAYIVEGSVQKSGDAVRVNVQLIKSLSYFNGELRLWLGWTQEVAGDHVAAQQSWRQARGELESFLKEQPENYLLIGDLALTNMGLGDKAAVLALSERAMAANPIEKDALTGPIPIEIFARVAARMGEPDRAIAALQELLSIPYAGLVALGAPLTPALLRLDPMFDPLRNDPRFQKLVASPAPR